MAREFAKGFYESAAWRRTRKAYAASVHWLCERCMKRGLIVRGDIVHHRKHLTPANITDTSVTLSFDNLELLCMDCHNKEHNGGSGLRDGFAFDAEGNLRPL